MAEPLPAPPFDQWPVQVYDPRFGFAWFAQPAALVTQVHLDHGTMEAANAIFDLIDLVFARAREPIRAAGGLLIMHDWRRVKSYDKEARSAFAQRIRGRKPGELRHSVVAVAHAHALLRMAVGALNLVGAVTARTSRIEAVETLEPELTRFQIVPPAPGVYFPGRSARSTVRPPR